MTGLRRSLLALGLLASCFSPTFSANGSETVNYSYDARGRLVQVSRSGSINDGVSASYCYDKADNRTNVSVATSGGGGPTPTFSVGSASVTEGGPVVFTVTKCPTTSGTLTVNYATSSGSAISGTDFTAASGTLSFLASETSKAVSVLTTDDAGAESAETFTFTLSNPSAGAVIGAASGTGTINDNDSTPTCSGVSFTIASNAAVTEGTSSVFTVTKTGSSSNSCSVSYATANGTATAGSDYTAASNSLTFTSAQTSQTVSVTTTDDTSVESAETFTMSLSSPTGGSTLGTPNSATATLNDNDGGACSGVSYSVNNASVTEGAPLVFTVTKAGTTTSSCSVNYATANGTATSPTHYTATSGTLTFTSTQTSKTITVQTIEIPRLNGTKTMYLNLSSPTAGATISDSQGVGSIDAAGDSNPCPLC